MSSRFVAALAVITAAASPGCKSSGDSATPASSSQAGSGTSAAPSAASSGASAARASKPTHSGPAKPHPAASPVVAFSTPGSDAVGGAPALDAAKVGLPRVDFGAPGRLVIKGYPQAIDMGNRDLATWLGYSKDEKQLIACGTMSPLSAAKGDEKGNTCFVNTGKETRELFLSEGHEHFVVGPELGAAITSLKEGDSRDLVRSTTTGQLTLPAITTTWPYASDIELDVATLPPPAQQGSGILKVGGHFAKEEPVYSISLSYKPEKPIPEVVWDAVWNAILVNRSNTELGFVGHFYCMEWCNNVVMARVRYDELASLIYNDTGFRHHEKKDYTASRDLFLRATWANPLAPLPPYNLACAYALLGDATNAEKALTLAIAVAGDKVKARAKKDADFKSALGAPWFKALTD